MKELFTISSILISINAFSQNTVKVRSTGGGGTIIDTANKWTQDVRSNAVGDSLIVIKNGERSAYQYPITPTIVVTGTDTFTNYLSNSGSNANNGLTTLTPKQTIASSQSVVNAKGLAGSTKLYFEGGSTFRETFTATAGNITFGAYNLTGLSKNSFPILEGADAYTSGWTLFGATSQTYTQSITHSSQVTYGYDYLFVIEVDKELEKTQPLTARHPLSYVADSTLVEATPGTFSVGLGISKNPASVFIHTTNNQSPNDNSKYRYEVAKRFRGVNAYTVSPNGGYFNNVFENIFFRDYTAGYGQAPSGFNSYYNHCIFGASGSHNLVYATGVVNYCLFLPSGSNVNTTAIANYVTTANGSRNRITKTVFLDIANPVISHTSGGNNHAAQEIDGVLGWYTPGFSSAFSSTMNTDTLIINNCYLDGYNSIIGINGAGSVTFIKNSFFLNNANMGNSGPNTTFENNLIKAYPTVQNGFHPATLGLNTNTKIWNNIFDGTSDVVGASGLYINNNAATAHINLQRNIFISNCGAIATMFGYNAGDTVDYNVYVQVGAGQIRWSNNLFPFATWVSTTGYDTHSKYIYVSTLDSVFVDARNNNYTLVKGGYGDTIRAMQAGAGQVVGMITPPTQSFVKPTQEQAYDWIFNSSMPVVQSITTRRKT